MVRETNALHQELPLRRLCQCQLGSPHLLIAGSKVVGTGEGSWVPSHASIPQGSTSYVETFILLEGALLASSPIEIKRDASARGTEQATYTEHQFNNIGSSRYVTSWYSFLNLQRGSSEKQTGKQSVPDI